MCLVGEIQKELFNKIDFNISVKDGVCGNSRDVRAESEQYILEFGWSAECIKEITERKEWKRNLSLIKQSGTIVLG